MLGYFDRRRSGGVPQTTWPEFWALKKMLGKGGEKEDPLGRAQKVASYGSTLLDIQKKQRDLAGPSPAQKDQEARRSGQVGSALEMFGALYKTASPSSKKILGEQLTSLWGMMNETERTKYKMLVSHTPINPDVQKAMWFEETNPRPRMPLVREGDGTWTNVPPRSPEYRNAWAEFDIATDEWNTLKEMAVQGKSAGEANWKTLPKQYQTENPKVTAYRDPIDKRVKYFDWAAADQAEILTAIEKGWATQADMMSKGVVPLSAPREYVRNGRPMTVRQVKEVVSGDTKLDYKAAGPREDRVEAPKALTDAVALIDSGKSPESLNLKSPAVVDYHAQLAGIVKASGEERLGLQLQLQQSIVAKYPSAERYLPFVPLDVEAGWGYYIQGFLDKVPLLNWVIPAPTVGGKGGNVVLVQADRLVDFYDKTGAARKFWWSDIAGIALDVDGSPIMETQGAQPGSALDLRWSD